MAHELAVIYGRPISETMKMTRLDFYRARAFENIKRLNKNDDFDNI